MDKKIDPQLAFLQESSGDLGDIAASRRFAIDTEAATPEATILVQYSGDPDDLAPAGLNVRSVAGDVVSGTIPLDRVDDLAAVPGVLRIESSREMYGELDLAVVESRVNLVHSGPPGRRGAGVIVGIVDSGIDFTHPSFRRGDGTTRILNIWDQGLNPQGGEASPAPFGYGVEYGPGQINAAINNANPFNLVRHRDDGLHGTHVSGIAAGDGSAAGNGAPGGTNLPPFTFIGVAPEADIIVVSANGGGNEGLGTSANTLDGVNYIYQKAAALGRAAVVNMSLGDNLGPHDGTSLLERGLDNLLGGPGRAFVKSAGNVGSAQHHAGGNVGNGASVDVGFAQPAGNTTPDQLDFWYEGADTFRAQVFDSAGNSTGVVNVGAATNFTLPGGNTVRIDHRANDPFNGDKRIFITIQRGTAAQIRPGNWRLRLTSVTSPSGGRFDGWIQRANDFNQRPTFIAPFESNSRTISTPGTALEVITAANYITRGAGIGSLASSSSRGPTRDGRQAPTVAAPGTNIISAFAHSTDDAYLPLSGTSMSAPHVTGVIALMFQKNKNRTQAQIKACLESSARSDAFTGPVPNTAWGAGKLDAKAAVDCVPGINPPSVVTKVCPPKSFLVAGCPNSVVFAQCGTKSVISICKSVVTACPGPALSVVCPQSTVTLCQPSVVTVSCPSRLNCPQRSVPAVTCGIVASANFNCPSSVGCPGGGFDPGPLVNPQLGGGIAQPIDPGRFRLPGGIGGRGAIDGGEDGGQAGGDDGMMPPEAPQPELPPSGFFEYDDGWFDEPKD